MISAAPHYKRAAATVLMIAAYFAARPSGRETAAPDGLAGGLQLRAATLGDGVLPSARQVRRVHPSLERISSWISSVGAAVALGDFDGDGLPNDACHVDPRTDSVTVRPVPGTGERYRPVILTPLPSPREGTSAPMGCLPGDMDEDGRVDLLVYFWGRTPTAFLRRDNGVGPGYVASEIVAGNDRWFTNAATFADVDGDAHADLILANYFADGARVLDPTAAGRESMQQSMSRSPNGGSKHLLRWDRVEGGVPRFEPVEGWIDPELIRGWALAVGAADLDGDLRPELYFANDFGRDHLLHNRSTPGVVRFSALRGLRGWSTPASKVVGADSFKGMGVDFADINRDGFQDIYVSNIAAEFALEESHLLFVSTNQPAMMQSGVAPFAEHSEPLGVARSGWAWDAKFADFDNDGVLEIVQATGFVKGEVDRWPELHELAMGNDSLVHDPANWPRFQRGADISGNGYNRLFLRRDGTRFHDVSAQVGTGQPQVTRGLAIADVDGDGLLDYAAANQWSPSTFYRNVTVGAGQFVGLHILFAPGMGNGTVAVHRGHPRTPGSSAVGAAVEIQLPGGSRAVAQVDGGNGHSGKRSPDVHVGLGQMAAGDTVRIQVSWRARDTVHRTTLHLQPGWHTVTLPRR